MSGISRTRMIKMIAAGGGLAVILTGAGFAFLGGDDGDGRGRQVAAGAANTSTTTPRPSSTAVSTSTTALAESETTTTTEAAAPAEADPALLELQQRLADLGYDVGTPDGFGGWQTHYAISAFQRVEGLDPTGEFSEDVRVAAAAASRPGPMVPGGESSRVEISLDRQVLFLWESGSLTRILPVSTGNGEYYCVDGDCDTAITPTGSFRIGRKYNGLEISPLGELYHPSYFYGGIAIHGSPSVPAYPASHGCVRIPMYASGSFHDQVPTGMAVYVIGNGPSASDVPPPPDDPVRPPTPPELPGPDPDTTTPTSKPDDTPPLTLPTSTTLPETTTTVP